jgi:hypothetical protein
MEKTNKNGIQIISDVENLERLLRERLDREKQEGFTQNQMVIEMCQAQDRETGQYSGRP